MLSELRFLLYIGLCAGQADVRDGPLPDPILSAWPSTVVPLRSKVTLQCSTPTPERKLIFTRGGVILETLLPSNATPSWTELPLSDLQQQDAGEYTCQYYYKGAPFIRSQPSNVLFLVVTGALPKPSLQSHQKGNVTAGEDVTLQCGKPDNSTESVVFALLKSGHSTPLQLQTSEESRGVFLLQTVSFSATGNYSCVYYWPNFPFSASFPSEELEIMVIDPCEGCSTSSPETGQTERTTSPQAAGTILGPIEITLIVVFSLVILFVAVFICKCILRGASSDKARSSHSSREPGEVVADAPTAMKSGSPA